MVVLALIAWREREGGGNERIRKEPMKQIVVVGFVAKERVK